MTPLLIYIGIGLATEFVITNSAVIMDKFRISSHPELFTGLQILHSTAHLSDTTCAILCSLTSGCAGFARSFPNICHVIDNQPIGSKPYIYNNGDYVYLRSGGRIRLLGYRASASTSDKPYDVLAATQTSGPVTSAGDLDVPLSVTFKHEVMERWGDLPITEVELTFRAAADDLRTLTFNAMGSTNKMNWMTKARLLSSPWTDLSPTAKTNFFSVVGDPRLNRRRFYVNRNYGGCGNDAGWLLLAEVNTGCGWEKKYSNHPVIIYSKADNATNMNGADIGLATDLQLLIVVQL